MRILIFLTIILLVSVNGKCQGFIHDSLLWASSIEVSTQTSPVFTQCDGSTISYTVSTPSNGGMMDITVTNSAIDHGMVFPASPDDSGNNHTQMQINISFSQPIVGLKIKLIDLDYDHNASYSNPEETISNFNINPSSINPTVGTVSWNGSTLFANSNNVSAWLEWNTSVQNLTFNYNRPGVGFGLVLGDVFIPCDQLPIEPEPVIPILQCEDPKVFVPNVFTPNKDGVNEYFGPQVDSCIALIEFRILNRWGNEVFLSNSIDIKWTGVDKEGNKLNDGVYFWMVKCKDQEGNILNEHGNVSLIR